MKYLRTNIHLCVIGALLLLTAFVWFTIATSREGVLTVAFLDVGQGDAIFVESPTGNQMLIDGGPSATVLRELGARMPFFDRTIDLLVISNPDKDHIAGFLDVLRSFNVSAVLEPGTHGASSEYRGLEEEIKKEGALHLLARRGQRVDLGGGVFFEILFPDRDISGMDTNDGSIVGKLMYGKTSFLFSGDAPESIESYVATLDGPRLKSDVLKAGHHGSRTSTSEALLGFASPLYAVISAGKGNRYGHPHQEVIDRLRQFEVESLGTYERGTIVFTSDGETVRLKGK